MGLALAPMGFYYGFVSTALPVLLRARGVSVEQVTWVSSVGFSPTFWAFLLCPILDVRFSKRAYAVFFAAVAAVCLGLSTLLTGNLAAFTAVVTVGCVATVLFSNAHQGWMPDAVEDKHYSTVGGVSMVANLGAAGVFAWVTVRLIRTLPAMDAAGLLALIVMLPTGLLFFIPLPAMKRKAPSEPFRVPAWLPEWFVTYLSPIIQMVRRWMPGWLREYLRPIACFIRDLYRVCRKRECVLGLICFLSPTACFALTNVFAALGADFHVSERWVTAINGPYVAIACSAGCLLGIWVCRRVERRTVYIVTGFGGAAAALGMIRAPHTLLYFAMGVLVYNFFTGINYTAFSAMEYEIVGAGNPLAATQMALLTASANLPISYMTAVDGHFHTTHGLGGMLAVDAVSSVVVGAALLIWFRRMGRANRRV
jgi:PAT family beta-lactamase induction signal transducer AmpG